jgi:hypothetical protein
MSDAAYHAQERLSRSKLMVFRHSPRVYEDQFILKKTPPKKPTNDMQIGTLTHVAVLQGAKLDSAMAVIPNSLLSADGGIRSKEARAWKAAAEAEGKIVVKDDERSSTLAPIIGMRDAILAHAVTLDEKPISIGSIIKNPSAECEKAIYWDDEEFELPMMALPDFSLKINSEVALVMDVKTIATLENAGKSIADDYWMQPPHYEAGVINATGVSRVVFLFVFVEKAPPYRVRVVRMSDQMMEKARQKWRETLAEFKRRITINDWSDPSECDVIVVDRPIWEDRL